MLCFYDKSYVDVKIRYCCVFYRGARCISILQVILIGRGAEIIINFVL